MAVAERHSQFPVFASERGERSSALTLRRGALAVGRGVLYVLLSLIFLIPFIWMIFGSLREEREIFQFLYPLSWHTFFPDGWTLKHWADILGLSDDGRRSGLNFGRSLANSFIVSTAVVISSLVVNTAGA